MYPGYEERAYRSIIVVNSISARVTNAFKKSNIWSGGTYTSGENNLSKIYVTCTERELRDCLDEEFGPRPHCGYYIVICGDEPREPKEQMASGW